MSEWQWIIEPGSVATGERADAAIAAAIARGDGKWRGEPRACSRSQLQKLIEAGAVSNHGQPIKSNHRIEEGDSLMIRFPALKELALKPEDRAIEVLYDDEHLLIVNKPPDLTVHPSSTQSEGTLVNALLHQLQSGALHRLSGIGGVLRPGIVHRIDKDTSGALVITKTDEAHQRLVETFSAHAIERAYWALSYGAPHPRSGTIESTIGRHPSDRKKMAMNVQAGRRAVTHYRTLEEFGRAPKPPFAAWLEVTLETGRTHQIRVHMTGQGNSLLGDPVYGTPSSHQPKFTALPAEIQNLVGALPGQALHARTLGFEHPVTGKPVRVEAPPPEGFAELLRALQSFKTKSFR